MYWLLWAIIAWLFTGTSFLLLRNTGSHVSNNIRLQFVYILVSFIVSGIVSLIILILYILKNKQIISEIQNFGKINIIFLGIILVGSYIFLEFASNKGGSPAFQIANLNIIISVIGGYIFFKERLNPVQLFGIFLGILAAAIIGGGTPIYNFMTKKLKNK